MLVVPNAVQRGAPAAVKRAREATLGCKGAKIFNLLPAWIRNINCVTAEKFKSELDLLLGGDPDQPIVPARHKSCQHKYPSRPTSDDILKSFYFVG